MSSTVTSLIIITGVGMLGSAEPQQADSPAASNATTQAIALVARACDSGDLVSCRNLGLMYAGGRNVQRDDAKAVTLYQRACDGNDTPACVSLGFMYESGRGIAKDEIRAAELYRKTCTTDVFSGCTNLGLMYANGRGLPKDDSMAVSLYQKACDQRLFVGCGNLGFMLEVGRGIAKDEVRAAALYQSACDQGTAFFCRSLGLMYANARGVARDDARASTLYRRACDAGVAAACTNLGYLYATGRGVSKDDAQSVQLYQRGCQGGDRSGCVSLSAALAAGKTLTDAAARPAPNAGASSAATQPAATPQPTPTPAVAPRSSSVLEFGTAFAVSNSGLFMTAFHVVDGATDVALRCDGKAYAVAVSARAPLVDLAVLQTKDKIATPTFLPLAMDGSPGLGQRVFTIGYPAPTMLGAEPKYTDGTVSSLEGLRGDASFLQVSVPIQPGNSGGALMDERGRVSAWWYRRQLRPHFSRIPAPCRKTSTGP